VCVCVYSPLLFQGINQLINVLQNYSFTGLLHAYESHSLAGCKGRTQTVFEYRMLRKIFGPRKEEITVDTNL
jgi:hypothetical protein